MTNNRINDEIVRLMEEAFDALREEQWATVEERARAVIALDPEHEEASRLLTAAGRMLEAGAPDPAPAPSSPPADAATVAERADPSAPETVTPTATAAAATAAGPGRAGQVARGAGRAALAVLRPLLVPVIIPLIVLIGAAVAADQGGVWDADGPLESTGLVDADGLLTRLRISGDDRLVWKLPFVGPGGAGGATPGGTLVGGATGSAGPGGTVAAGTQPAAPPPPRVPPQLDPPAPYDVAEVTAVISPFSEDAVLFGFATPDGMVVTVSGSRDAGGLPDRTESVTLRRGPVTSTTRVDSDGLVTRAESFDESSGNSSALSFVYAGDTVTITKHATAEDERPVSSINTALDPAVAELIAVLREFSTAARAPQGAPTTSISQRAEPTSIVMTANVVRGEDRLKIAGDQFSVEWELVIPGGYLNVANNRVAWDFRTGPMRWAGDHYEAAIPIWRPMSPSQVANSCLKIQGEAIKTATALNILGALIGGALSGSIAGEGALANWVVGDLIGLPFENFAKLFAEVPTLPSSINLMQGEFLKAVSEGTISIQDGLVTALNRLGTADGTVKYLLADARRIRERLRDPASATSDLMKCHVIGQDRFDHETTQQWKVAATVIASKRPFTGPTGTGIDYDRRTGRHPDVGTKSAYVEVGTSQHIRTAATLTVDAAIVVQDDFMEITLEDLDNPDRYWEIDSRAPEFVTAVATDDEDQRWVLSVSVSGGTGPFFALLSDSRCEIEFSTDETADGDAESSGSGDISCAFSQPGAYDVGIAITDAHGTKVSRLFGIRAIQPLQITSVTPSVVVGQRAQGITINGAGFLPGSGTSVVIDAPFVTVKFLRFVSDTLLAYEVDVPESTPPGDYAVHVFVEGVEATLPQGLSVTASAPVLEITSVTPAVVAGQDGQGITINGRGFLPGSQTVIVFDAPFVTVTFLRFVSDTLLAYEVNVPTSTPPGRYAAHVIVDGVEATLANALEVRAVAASGALAPSPTATATTAPAAATATPAPAATAAAPAEQFSIARYVDDKDYEYYFVHPTADTGALRRMDLRAMHGFCTGNTNTTAAPYTLVRGPFNSRAEAVASFATELTDRRTIGLGCYDPVSDLAGSNKGWVYLSGEIANALPAR